VAGLENPDEGAIYFDDSPVVLTERKIMLPPEKRNIGMVFQSYAIWPHMTVAQNVGYPLRMRKVPSAKIRDRVAEVLSLVGMPGMEKRPAPLLSGGQQQRVAPARAIVTEPDLLLLDEPFSNLDAKLREQMRLELKLLHRRLNVTVLFVTHDQMEALSLSDRIAVMRDGQVEQLGAPQALYEQPRTVFVRDFLGQTILLSGKLRTVDEETGSVALEDEAGDLTGRIAAGAQLSPGQDVSVSIRPEDVAVELAGAGGQASNTLPATIEAPLFVGDRYQVGVALDSGKRLLLSLARSRRWEAGERLDLWLPPAAVSIWPA